MASGLMGLAGGIERGATDVVAPRRLSGHDPNSLPPSPPEVKQTPEATPPEVQPRGWTAETGNGEDAPERREDAAAGAPPEWRVADEGAAWREGLLRVVNDLIFKTTSLELGLQEERHASSALRAQRDELVAQLEEARAALEEAQRQQEAQTKEAVAAALRAGDGAAAAEGDRDGRPPDFSHIRDPKQRLQALLAAHAHALAQVRALEGQMGPVVQDSTVAWVRNLEVGMVVVRGGDGWRSGDVDGGSWGVVLRNTRYGRTRVHWHATGLECEHVTTQSGSELREAPRWAVDKQ
ncbi:hypothetical protein HYH02_014819 [Chlamydomonas schloesseri]|uniref:Uncharacterized protein n=1 Tax=Chlamydomonas schloesseri TaxID=2026947 RepID=A0A835SK14_9CHLO|nr:hypothetical protein HYH02_014819 [Chlamydomonas schloesseri]|eukprot:KAG2426392.1 hypothetical protein HYH02_014819 [Chlamydomonas schloesseri]